VIVVVVCGWRSYHMFGEEQQNSQAAEMKPCVTVEKKSASSAKVSEWEEDRGTCEDIHKRPSGLRLRHATQVMSPVYLLNPLPLAFSSTSSQIRCHPQSSQIPMCLPMPDARFIGTRTKLMSDVDHRHRL
jgi:hypothetical protein